MNINSRAWVLLLMRGILAILFGAMALYSPVAAAAAIVWIFGIYALLDGFLALVTAFHRTDRGERWWGLIFQGICGIAAGIIALTVPLLAAISLVYLVATWAILTGIFEIVAAVRLRRVIAGEFWLVLTGIVSVALGIALFLLPLAGIVAWTVLAGIYALFYGVAMVLLALRLRTYAASARLDSDRFRTPRAV